VMEARRATELGLSVAAVSCITNKAAGLSDSILSHHDVEATAKLAVERLGRVLESLL
jgi:purine-nucleoside phosphorylase